MNGQISVVVTTYNGEKYILEQLDSIRTQSMAADEVIILDDGSKDNTVRVVEEFIQTHGLHSWKCIRNPVNMGWKANFKKGFDLAAHEFVFPCDQDDIWLPDKCRKMLQVMNEHPELEVLASDYDILMSESDHGSGAYVRNERKMKKDGSLEFRRISPKWAYIKRPGCTYCFRKSFYLQIRDSWDTRFPHDAVLWRYAAMRHSLAVLHEGLIRFRRHGDNSTSGLKRTNASCTDTFNDYLYFYRLAYKTVESEQEKEILKKGILFLKRRKQYYRTRNIFLWLKLYLRYHAYYDSILGWLGDLYFPWK